MSGKPRDFKEAMEQLGEGAEDVRGKLEGELRRIEETLKSMQPGLKDLGQTAKGQVEARVQKHPWATIGLVGLLALAIGYLLGSRSRE